MIHKYELNGCKIVLDVNSSSVHVVDELTWLIIDYMEQDKPYNDMVALLSKDYKVEDIEACYEEIQELIKEKMLFAPDIYKEFVIREGQNHDTKALCLNIAHDCDLRCGYCFASTGNYHGGRKLMPLDIAKKSIDFLLKTSGNKKNLELDFFGGEPLLNFDVIKQTVEYAREAEKAYGKNISFTMTTNSTMLNDEINEFLNENMKNVVLSIDGRKEVNDAMRKTSDGKGTYDIIMPNIKKFVASRGDKSYYVRGTFTADNLDFINDVKLFADQGFREISIEPVVLPDTSRYALKAEHLPIIFEQYELLAQEILKRKAEDKNFNFYHYMIDLNGGPCVYKRVTACGSGVEYFAISPEGDIYPCHQFVGEKDFMLGTLDTGIINKDLVKKMDENTVYHKQKCQDCWAKFYCSGGCRANAYHFNNDMKIPYEMECELQKKRTECAIMLKAMELMDK